MAQHRHRQMLLCRLYRISLVRARIPCLCCALTLRVHLAEHSRKRATAPPETSAPGPATGSATLHPSDPLSLLSTCFPDPSARPPLAPVVLAKYYGEDSITVNSVVDLIGILSPPVGGALQHGLELANLRMHAPAVSLHDDGNEFTQDSPNALLPASICPRLHVLFLKQYVIADQPFAAMSPSLFSGVSVLVSLTSTFVLTFDRHAQMILLAAPYSTREESMP
jgi:hypothetical protein